MTYNQYLLNDFVVDHYFINWVKSPDPHSDAFWENWLKENPEKKAVVEEARQLVLFLSNPGRGLREKDKNQIWEKIRQRNTAQEARLKHQKMLLPRSWKYSGRVAAGLVILLSAVAFWFGANRRPAMIRYSTHFNQVKKITLPDASTVTLNANSSLSYPAVWEEKETREVSLTGEAFFEVVRKAGQHQTRFVVHTPGGEVEVLGTAFNVHNRRGKVQVVLQKGKVRFTQPGRRNSPILMSPGDLVEYCRKKDRLKRLKVNPLVYASWKEKETLFEEKPLSEIAQLLEDTRGVKVVLGDHSLKQLRFTGSMPNEDLDKFLWVLAKSFRISIRKSGNKIMLLKEDMSPVK